MCDNHLRAEDPVYAKQMGLILDHLYYLDHKVMNPVAILFDPILGEEVPSEQHLSDDTRERKRAQRVIHKLLGSPEVQSKLQGRKKAQAIRRRNFVNKSNRQSTITTFFGQTNLPAL